MYQFTDAKSLQTLITELLKLKDLVKCPICLDVVKDPVQVRCTHTFCKDCLIAFQNANAPKYFLCPICRKPIFAKKSTNCRVEQLAKFVRDTSDKLNVVFDCGGLDVGTLDKVTAKLRQLQGGGSSSNHKTASKSKATICTKSPNAERRPQVFEEPPLYQNNLSPFKHSASPSKDHIFNQFIKSSVPTRYKNIRTYDRKKTSTAPVVTYNKVIGFEDDTNKTKIIRWLTDSRNHFERLTQTQDLIEPAVSPHTFDFPSISQENQKHMRTYSESLKKIRNSRAKLAGKSRHERRARSLEFAIGSYAESPVFKRHSLACETPDFEETHIEEVESQSDINDVMHLMEEDCLDTLEKDMNLGHEERARKSGELLTGQNVQETTGWSRIKEIKKVIKKEERKPKKLDVSFTPVGSSLKSKMVEKRPIVLLTRYHADKIKKSGGKDLRSSENPVHKVYNLNEIETYIEGNISKCRGESNDESVAEETNEIVPEENSKMLDANCLQKNAPEGVNSMLFNNGNVPEESCESLNKEGVLEGSHKSDSPGKVAKNEGSSKLFSNESIIDESARNEPPSKVPGKQETFELFNKESIMEKVVEDGHQTNVAKKEKEKVGTSRQEIDAIDLTIAETDLIKEPPSKADVEKNRALHDDSIEKDLFVQPTQILELDENQRVADDIEGQLEAIFNTQREETRNEILNNKINLAIEMMTDFNKVFTSTLNDSSPKRFDKIKELCDEIHQLLKEEEPLFKSPGCLKANNTTQTVHLGVQDEQIQTDEVSTRGFRISSSASFKTPHFSPGVDVETQTEPFACGNCRRGIFSQRQPSEVLIQNRDLAKHLADKYEFTQSLDNVQFDTQDMVKDTTSDKTQFGTKDAVKNTQSKLHLKKTALQPPKLQDKYEFTQSLDDIQINTCDILQGMLKNVREERGGSNSKSPSQFTNKYRLDGSLDNVNFNTNEITVKQSLQSGGPKPTSGESDLAFSISANTSRRFKRIRTPSSDSESDSENPKKITKRDKIRMRDDLSVVFISSGEDVDAATRNDTLALSMGGSENIDYDEYLEKIMKKYDTEVPCSTPKRLKRDKTQPDGKRLITSPRLLLANKIETRTEIQRQEDFSESLFSNGPCPKENVIPPSGNIVVDEFKKHLRQNEPEGKKSDDKIVILQNVVLKPDDVVDTRGFSKLPYDLDEELAKMEENADKKSQTSEDMFLSESEDLDVVETTPQKRSPLRFPTQSLQKIKELPPLANPPRGASSCLDVTLPPPIEFQDFMDNEDFENIPDPDVTLVSQIPAMDLENDDTLKQAPCNPSSFTQINASPVPSEKLLHISPIRPGRKVFSPIDVVSNSRFSPLDIIIKPERRKTLATSTPKQKSILNYIHSSQQLDTPGLSTIPTSEKKPCVACTRLTKEQVLAISSLTNKKLATYSSSFHPRVTHMIVSVNNKNCVKDHTIKFVSAVASRIWVLGYNWVQECLDRNRIVEEEPFEVLDVSGIPGPRTARLTGAEAPLLKGYVIHAAPPFVSTTRKDIEDIVRLLGGEVVSTPEALQDSKGVRIIITEARATQDFELYEIWLARLGVVTVDIEWLSRSVGQYQLLSLRPFALCSEDTIGDLGYPPELLVNTPFSFSQSMYST